MLTLLHAALLLWVAGALLVLAVSVLVIGWFVYHTLNPPKGGPNARP